MDWTSITVEIDGTDFTEYLYNNAEQVATLPYGPEIGRATFTLRDADTMPVVNEWSEIILYANSETVWGGFVTRITSEPQSMSGGPARLTTLDCQSYAILLLIAERLTATFGGGTTAGYDALTYDNDVVDEIILKLLPEVYDAGSISSTSPVDLEYISFDYETLRGALNKIVERTNKEFGVTPDKNFYYRPAGTLATYSYGLSDNPNNTTTFPMKIKPVYDVDAIDLRNSVVVVGGWTLSEIVVETFTGDAVENIFTVQYRPERVESVTVDGVAQRVGVDFVDDPAEFDVLVNWDRQWFRFTYPPILGASIIIRYRYPVRIVEIVQDAANITAIGRELWGNTIEDTTISSVAQAQQTGLAYLERATTLADRAQVTTNYSTVSGLPWEPGGTVQVTAAALGWAAKAMKIESVTLRAQARPDGVAGACLIYWDLNLGTQSTLGQTSGSREYKNSSTFDVRPSHHVPEIMAPATDINVSDFLLRNDGVSGNFQALDGTLIYVIDGQIVSIGPATSVASNQHSCMTAAILGGVFTGSVYEDAKYFLSGKV